VYVIVEIEKSASLLRGDLKNVARNREIAMTHDSNRKQKPKRATVATGTNGKAGKKPTSRSDLAGHLDPAHAARLLRLSRETDQHDANVGFVAGPRSKDAMAEQFGEETVSAMTSGEGKAADDWNEHVEEEDGGPFIATSGDEEFATGTDESNTADATREPFPKTSSSR
jgi:hypothetical protein